MPGHKVMKYRKFEREENMDKVSGTMGKKQ